MDASYTTPPTSPRLAYVGMIPLAPVREMVVRYPGTPTATPQLVPYTGSPVLAPLRETTVATPQTLVPFAAGPAPAFQFLQPPV